MSNWQRVRTGDTIGFSQGYAINLLCRKYKPNRVEMGFIKDEEGELQAYRLTFPNNKQVTYKDTGCALELVKADN